MNQHSLHWHTLFCSVAILTNSLHGTIDWKALGRARIAEYLLTNLGASPKHTKKTRQWCFLLSAVKGTLHLIQFLTVSSFTQSIVCSACMKLEWPFGRRWDLRCFPPSYASPKTIHTFAPITERWSKIAPFLTIPFSFPLLRQFSFHFVLFYVLTLPISAWNHKDVETDRKPSLPPRMSF